MAVADNSVDPDSGYCSRNGIFYSKRPFEPLPSDPLLTLPQFLFEKAKAGLFLDRTCYIEPDSGRSISYGDLHLLIQSAAAGMSQLGLQKGDVVLLLSPNSIWYTVVLLGAMSLGAIITTCNPRNLPAEIAKQASESNAKWVATTPALIESVAPLKLPTILMVEAADEHSFIDKKEMTIVEQKLIASIKLNCLLNDAPFITLGHLIPSISTVSSIVSRKASTPCSIPHHGLLGMLKEQVIVKQPDGVAANSNGTWMLRQDDTAALLYSSGTTGVSKGVMISHKNLISHAILFTTRGGRLPWASRVYLCLIPMFHAYGLCMFCSAVLATGSKIVILSRYDTIQMLAAIQEHRVTHLLLVPPIFLLLAKASLVEEYDLSSVVEVSVGAAPVSSSAITAFCARFPNVTIMQGYGLTESTAVGANTACEEETQNYMSVGLLSANTEAKVVDVDSGKPVPPNVQGEILIRGPTIMQGYLGKPEETRRAIDEEGWLHTGDLGYIDARGFVYIVDRLKELIKYKGYQVAPAELESVLLLHPQIADAAVIPYPDEEAGQIPMAYVVKANGSSLSNEDVMSFVAQKVAPYKKIRRVQMVSSISKTPSGKILRRELIKKAVSKL